MVGCGLHSSSSTKYCHNWSFLMFPSVLYPPIRVGLPPSSSILALFKASGRSATGVQTLVRGLYISAFDIDGFSTHQPSQPPATSTLTLDNKNSYVSKLKFRTIQIKRKTSSINVTAYLSIWHIHNRTRRPIPCYTHFCSCFP